MKVSLRNEIHWFYVCLRRTKHDTDGNVSLSSTDHPTPLPLSRVICDVDADDDF